MSFKDDYSYYQEEAALEAFIKDSLKDISEDNIRAYLGTYGDAIEGRVKECIRQSEELYRRNYYGQSLTGSLTAIEIIIRFLLLRPLVQGAFLSDEWAEILSKRIATGRSAEDRELLPAILKQWGIDIETIQLTNKKGLWDSIHKMWKRRNDFVHSGEHIDESEASLGIECAGVILNQVVYPVAARLGFTLDVTGKWHKIRKENADVISESGYISKNPFQKS